MVHGSARMYIMQVQAPAPATAPVLVPYYFKREAVAADTRYEIRDTRYEIRDGQAAPKRTHQPGTTCTTKPTQTKPNKAQAEINQPTNQTKPNQTTVNQPSDQRTNQTRVSYSRHSMGVVALAVAREWWYSVAGYRPRGRSLPRRLTLGCARVPNATAISVSTPFARPGPGLLVLCRDW